MYHIVREPIDTYILVRESKRTSKSLAGSLAGHRYWDVVSGWDTGAENRYAVRLIIASFANEARALAAYQALYQLVNQQDTEAVALRRKHRDEIAALLEAHKE